MQIRAAVVHLTCISSLHTTCTFEYRSGWHHALRPVPLERFNFGVFLTHTQLLHRALDPHLLFFRCIVQVLFHCLAILPQRLFECMRLSENEHLGTLVVEQCRRIRRDPSPVLKQPLKLRRELSSAFLCSILPHIARWLARNPRPCFSTRLIRNSHGLSCPLAC